MYLLPGLDDFCSVKCSCVFEAGAVVPSHSVYLVYVHLISEAYAFDPGRVEDREVVVVDLVLVQVQDLGCLPFLF